LWSLIGDVADFFMRGRVGGMTLTTSTIRRIEILFPEPQRAEIAKLLIEKCSDVSPIWGISAERLQFSILKLGNGDFDQTVAEIKLAQGDDPRDVLMAADFGNEPHLLWLVDKLDPIARRADLSQVLSDLDATIAGFKHYIQEKRDDVSYGEWAAKQVEDAEARRREVEEKLALGE
jgi:hypothetical protein